VSAIANRSTGRAGLLSARARWVVLLRVANGDVESIRVLGQQRRGARADVLAPHDDDDDDENDRRRRAAASLVYRATAWRRLPAGRDVDDDDSAGSGTLIVVDSSEGTWIGEASGVEWSSSDAAGFDLPTGSAYLVDFIRVKGRPVACFAPSPGGFASVHSLLPLSTAGFPLGLADDSLEADEPAAAPSSSALSAAIRSVRNAWLGIGCATVFAAIAAARFVTFNNGRGPATIDSGNWLAFAESLFGAGQRDPSITYPPFIPFLAHIAVGVFGLTAGIAMLAAVSSVVPAAGLYIALTMARVGPVRIFPVLLIAGLGSVGEAASWGGFPQLWSMGVLPIGAVAAMRLFDEPTRRNALFLGTALMVALATSHLGGLVLVVSLLVSLALDTMIHRSADRARAVIGVAPLVLLPSVWLIPTYLKLIDAVVLDPNEFAELDNLTVRSAIAGLADVAPQIPVLWQVLIPLGLLAPILGSRDRAGTAWRATTTLLISVILLIVVTREGRYLSFVPFVTAATFGVWIDERLRRPIDRDGPRRWLLILLVVGASAAVTAQFVQTHRALAGQRDFYGWLSDDLVYAIGVADDIAPDDRGIAIPSLNDAPIGWWVEGLTEHDVTYGSPLRWLNFSDEVDRATVANAIFSPDFPEDSSLEQLRDVDVSVVILPRRWAWFEEGAVNEWIISNELVVRFDSAEVLVIDLGERSNALD
jgi:hypothetical protein